MASVKPHMLSRRAAIAQRWRNRFHTFLLLSCLTGFFAIVGRLTAGPSVLLAFTAIAAVSLALSTKLAPRILLWRLDARPLRRWEAPELHALSQRFAAQAGLPASPKLFLLPQAEPVAFTTGHGNNASIALSAGLLRALSRRELSAVLAHELGHIRNGDTLLLSMADGMSAIVRALSFLGILLLIANLPLTIASTAPVAWELVALLVLAPQAMLLLQLALSRAREFDADLAAAELTGDPIGLAEALRKIEFRQRNLWRRLCFPVDQDPVPSLLRTHPPTEERIARLLDLSAPPPTPIDRLPAPSLRLLEIEKPDSLHRWLESQNTRGNPWRRRSSYSHLNTFLAETSAHEFRFPNPYRPSRTGIAAGIDATMNT